MSLLDRKLVAGETILFRQRKSKMIFFDSILVLIGAIVFAGLFFALGWFEHLGNTRFLIAITPILIGILLIIFDVISYLELELVVTNRRVMVKKGLGALTVLDIHLNQVTNVRTFTPFFGALFGYGTVSIFTASCQFDCDKLHGPRQVQQKINDAIISAL